MNPLGVNIHNLPYRQNILLGAKGKGRCFSKECISEYKHCDMKLVFGRKWIRNVRAVCEGFGITGKAPETCLDITFLLYANFDIWIDQLAT